MRKIGMVVYPGFQAMCFMAFSAFEVANRRSGETLYDLHVLSERGGLLQNSFGMNVSTKAIGDDEFDTILVGVGMEVPSTSPAVASYLRQAAKSARRLASICLGSFALGDTGLLDGRRATTHWRYAQQLQKRFPKCKVDMVKIFITDGQIWTSAGMSAASDLAVSMIESDYGADLAQAVASEMVMHHRRADGQSQHSALLSLDAKSDRIQTALAYAKRTFVCHSIPKILRYVAGQGCRGATAGSGEADARTEQASRRRHCKGSGFRQPGTHAPYLHSGLWRCAAINPNQCRAARNGLAVC